MVVINVIDLLANINILCEIAKYIAKNIRKKVCIVILQPCICCLCLENFSPRLATVTDGARARVR